VADFDLVLIGTGSGNSIPGPSFADWRIAVVEAGDFGGTCLNVGCIPTKMFVYPADVAEAASGARQLGLRTTFDGVDWTSIRDRVFRRVDDMERRGRAYRKGPKSENTAVFEGWGRFTGPRSMSVAMHDGSCETFTADRFVVATGSRPTIPDILGLDSDLIGGVVHTSDTVMRLDEMPRHIAIVGGGYIAAEFAHVFTSFGGRVTQLVRGPRVLKHHDHDISDAFTTLAAKRYDLRRDTAVSAIEPGADDRGVTIHLECPYGDDTVDADVLLIATGRRPNTDRLGLRAAGITVDAHGQIVVDSYQRTSVDGIFALGDVSSPFQLKHVANHEARVVAHNLANPDDMVEVDHRFVPAAVFTEPQIASVGMTEQQAIQRGVRYVAARQPYSRIAAGWAREDTTGFLKLLADPQTGRLLGAHVIGPEAATVIQPLIQAMSFGQSARDLARGQYWIHPALPELVENALLGLDLD
jgi:mycothione reductase